MRRAHSAGMKLILTAARNAAPYLLVEILLPGGSLIALAMWMYRHDSKAALQRLVWIRKITGLIPSPSR